jgi:hypothetical protein
MFPLLEGHIFFRMSIISLNLRPFKLDLIFGNSQKSYGARSGEQDGCSILVIGFWVPRELEHCNDGESNRWAKVQALSTHVTVSLSTFGCTAIALILKRLSECSRFRTFSAFRPKYPPQRSVLKNPQSMFLPLSERPTFAPKITILYIIIFRFFDIRQEDKRHLHVQFINKTPLG